MNNGIFSVPDPRNEPVLAYAPGSPERRALRAQMEKMSKEVKIGRASCRERV